MRLREARAFALVLALSACAASALAQPRDPARADALFREGREAMRQKDYEAACARFAESQRLDPGGGTLLNLADCEEKLGHPATAYRHVQGALATLPAGDDRVRIARQRLTALEGKVARLVVRVAKSVAKGARVTRDGQELPEPEWGQAHALEPGTHALVLTLADGREVTASLALREGELREVTLEPPPEPAAPTPPTSAAPAASSSAPRAAPVPPPPPRRATSPTSITPWVIGGVGAAGLVVAGVSLVLLEQKKSVVTRDCDQDAGTCTTQAGVDAASSGRSLEPVFYVSGVIGLAGVAVGAVWLLSTPAPVSVGVSPGGVRVGGRF